VNEYAHRRRLPALLDALSYTCPDCATSTPLTVAAAGCHGFYVGYICPRCLYAVDILGILATRELAQALLLMLAPAHSSR
jgi:hypothetical protein